MRPLVGLLALLIPFSACDSAGADRETVARELQADYVRISRTTARVTLGADAGEIACADGGSAYLQPSKGGGSLSFDACAGLTGTVTWTYPVDTSHPPRFRQRVDGTVSVEGGCVVTYRAMEYSFEYADPSGDSSLTHFAYDGALSGDCPSGRTTCTFSNVSLTVNAAATPDLTPYCR